MKMDLEQAIRQEKDPDVQDLLTELQSRRSQVAGLKSALQASHERFSKFQQAVGVSPDSNVHLHISVSKEQRAWQVAHQVSSELFNLRVPPEDVLKCSDGNDR